MSTHPNPSAPGSPRVATSSRLAGFAGRALRLTAAGLLAVAAGCASPGAGSGSGSGSDPRTLPAVPPADAAPDRPMTPPTPPAPPTPEPTPDPAPPTTTEDVGPVTLRPGLMVRPAVEGVTGAVMIESVACLEAGWLEQVACGVGTREHESLLVIEIPPSDLHAAMLLAGFEPGQPGRWSVDTDGRTRLDPPTGDLIDIAFEWETEDGERARATPRDWIVSEDGSRRMDDPRWRYGGSRLVSEQGRLVDEGSAEDARYLADLTGSIIGLVTFGDEVLGLEEIIPDAATYAEPAWMVDSEAIPPLGTEVTIVLTRGE